jgi:hypothetical protein
VQTSFPELIFSKNVKKYRIRSTLAGYPVSGLTGYPAVKSGIRPDIKKTGLSDRISGASLVIIPLGENNLLFLEVTKFFGAHILMSPSCWN